MTDATAPAEPPIINPYTGKARHWASSITLGDALDDATRKQVEDSLDFFESDRHGKKLMKAVRKHHKDLPLEIQPVSEQPSDDYRDSNHYEPKTNTLYLKEGAFESNDYYVDSGEVTQDTFRSVLAHEMRHSVHTSRERIVAEYTDKFMDLKLPQLEYDYKMLLYAQSKSDEVPEYLTRAKENYVAALSKFEPYRQRYMDMVRDDELTSMKEEAHYLPNHKTRAAYLLTSLNDDGKPMTVGEFHNVYEDARQAISDPTGSNSRVRSFRPHAKDALESLEKIARKHGIDVKQVANELTSINDADIRKVYRENGMMIPEPQDANLSDMSKAYYAARTALKPSTGSMVKDKDEHLQIPHDLQKHELKDRLAGMKFSVEGAKAIPTSAPALPAVKSDKSTGHSH